MIFYGRNSGVIGNGQLRNVICPNCEKESAMTYSVYGKYAHLYWVPFFPMGRTNIVECNSCKATYDVKDLDQKIKDKFSQELERNPVKTPIKHFSMVGVIALIIVGVVINGFVEKNSSGDYAKNPKVGDIYYFETPELKGHYSTLKITKITTDSIFVMENNLEVDSKTNMDKVIVDKNYTIPSSYSKKEMKDITKDLEVFFKITRD